VSSDTASLERGGGVAAREAPPRTSTSAASAGEKRIAASVEALTCQPPSGLERMHPLDGCRQFSTRNPHEAVEQATKLLSPHQLTIEGDLDDFWARASRAELSGASLYHLDYRTAVTFHCSSQSTYVAVLLPMSDGMSIRYDRGEVVDVPAGSLAVVPAECPVDIRFRRGFSLLSVSANTETLLSGLRRFAPDLVAEQLPFQAFCGTAGGSSEMFYGLVKFAAALVDNYRSPASMPSRVIDTLRDQIVSTFLLGLPHDQSAPLLRRSGPPITSRLVRRSLHLMASDDGLQRSITDIAAQLCISVRALEIAFRKELDCTPRDYLQRLRLQRAHEALCQARPGDGTTVTDVATRCGFGHTGRFAALYRRIYGVHPSDRLRK
jgi:AraC-like DNA-binding protein